MLVAGTAGIFYILGREKTHEVTGRISELGYGACTMDVPSSSCGSYTIKVQTADGATESLKVRGYPKRNNNREAYEKISGLLNDSKQHNKEVVLTVNEDSEIISAR
jgi:uncharacterized protein YigE (DUF2233 family)